MSLLPLAGALFSGGESATRAGPNKILCAAAYEEAQEQRNAGHLLSAREKLLVCSDEACPSVVRQDCLVWLDEVVAILPSIVIRVRDGDGRDASNVHVLVDGEPWSGWPERSQSLDPGSHVLRIEAEGMQPIEQRITIAAGERDRILTYALEPLPSAAAPSAAAPSAAAPSAAAPSTNVRVDAPPVPPIHPSAEPPIQGGDRSSEDSISSLTYVLAAATVMSTSAFAYFGSDALKRRNDLRRTCAPDCEPSDVDPIRVHGIVADVLLIVSLASAGMTAWSYFRQDSPAPP